MCGADYTRSGPRLSLIRRRSGRGLPVFRLNSGDSAVLRLTQWRVRGSYRILEAQISDQKRPVMRKHANTQAVGVGWLPVLYVSVNLSSSECLRSRGDAEGGTVGSHSAH